MSPVEFLRSQAMEIQGDELRARIEAVIEGIASQRSAEEFADSQGWSRGISGYINQTVPTALYCWAQAKDFRQSVTSAIRLGGDTDTVAAIAGAVSGANLGVEQLPQSWIESLAEWPRDVGWLKQLAEHLDQQKNSRPPAMHWLATVPRNCVFATIVLGIGFRRLVLPV